MFQDMGRARKILLSDLVKVMKVMLILPATNAFSERSFSALKRLKTYTRSTIHDHRMNHLMILRIHKERT